MGMLSDAHSVKPKSALVSIDQGLYNALEAIASMRETTVETIMEMQLIAFVRAYERGQIFEPDDVMPYGQYKGFKVGDMIKVNPRYVNYLLSNSPIFRLSEASINLMSQLAVNNGEEPQIP